MTSQGEQSQQQSVQVRAAPSLGVELQQIALQNDLDNEYDHLYGAATSDSRSSHKIPQKDVGQKQKKVKP